MSVYEFGDNVRQFKPTNEVRPSIIGTSKWFFEKKADLNLFTTIYFDYIKKHKLIPLPLEIESTELQTDIKGNGPAIRYALEQIRKTINSKQK